ncbi:MAG TPA: hypothetical protein VJQ82_24305 [Terriglobales bacterium]|nr:hypothetical protein [Terriglobales bacterium]
MSMMTVVVMGCSANAMVWVLGGKVQGQEQNKYEYRENHQLHVSSSIALSPHRGLVDLVACSHGLRRGLYPYAAPRVASDDARPIPRRSTHSGAPSLGLQSETWLTKE